MSGKDKSSPSLWLATWASNMELSYLLGTTRRVPQEKFLRKTCNKFFNEQACSIKVTGYCFRSVFASLWTSMPSQSINSHKTNLANIRSSWPHTWSITHISFVYRALVRYSVILTEYKFGQKPITLKFTMLLSTVQETVDLWACGHTSCSSCESRRWFWWRFIP